MKITTYNQNNIPTDKDAEVWVHFIYVDTSGWIGIDDCEDFDDIGICEEIIKQMETKSGEENELEPECIKEEIDGYKYTDSNIGELTRVIVATPYRGEETIFILAQ